MGYVAHSKERESSLTHHSTRAPNTIHISIDDLRHTRTFPPSASVSEDDEDGVQVSPQGPSPQYSIIQPPGSHSGPSSHSGDGGVFPLPLAYPLDIPEPEPEPDAEAHPYHQAGRPPHRHRHPSDTSRSSSIQRENSRRVVQLQGPYRAHRVPPSDSIADEAESTEAFLQGPEHAVRMPRGQSYHDQGGYTHSSSSSSYTYPQVPHQSHQVVAYAPTPVHPALPYTHAPPAPYAYPPQQPHAYLPPLQPLQPHPGHNMTAPYAHPAVHQYPPGYFQHYGQMPPNPYYAPQYQNVPPQMASYVQYPVAPQHDHIRALTASPAHIAPVQVASPPTVDENAMMEKFQALLLAERTAREKKDTERQNEAQSVEERFAAMRAAERERREQETRIREEARREALEAEKARLAAEVERLAYESRIRKEAAEAALAAAAAETKARQQQADREAQIAADATETAKKAATKEAKIAAEAAEAAAKAAKVAAEAKEREAAEAAATTKKEHEAKLKEVEAAAEAAKKEAEAAAAKVAGLSRTEKKAPLKFKDALGRTFNFPWDRCYKWDDMEALINQAFAHIENIGPHVKQGHYSLIGPDKETILRDYWEDSIAPGMHISMMLWPMPDSPPAAPEPLPPPMGPLMGGSSLLDEDIIDVDALLANARKSSKHKPNSSKKKPTGGLTTWMLGGAAGARARPSSKDSKKPEAVVVHRHGATDAGACTVM